MEPAAKIMIPPGSRGASGVIAALLVACAKPAKQVPSSEHPSATVFEPSSHLVLLRKTDSAEGGYQFDADFHGTLLEIDGCIRVMDDDAKRMYTPVWSRDTKRLRASTVIQVMHAGKPIARLRIGDAFSANGGFIPSDWARSIADTGDCPGPFWLMGYDIDTGSKRRPMR